jgi:hypothetical protein
MRLLLYFEKLFCMKKLLLLTVSIVFFINASIAQSFEVPEGYSFKNKEECSRYEKDIIAASKWLFATPANEQEDKRKQVAKFVAEWMLNSPTVNAEMTQAIMDFESINPGMMVLYFAGCSLYVLENNYSTDIRAKHRFALEAMMKYYENNSMKKDKKMKTLIKQNKEGKLNEWIEINMPVRS